MFGKIRNVFRPFLKRISPLFDKLLMPGWLSNLCAERVIAIMSVARQYNYRNRIGFVEPQQNCAFKLPCCRSLLVRHIKGWAKIGLRLFARLTAHSGFESISNEATAYEVFAAFLCDVKLGFNAHSPERWQGDKAQLLL